MKLATFTPDNCISLRGHSTKPTLGISQKAGVFRFNKALVEKLKFTPSTLLQWHQDEKETGDWYIEVVKKDGFPLRQNDKLSPNGLIMQSSSLAKKIFASVDCVESSGHVTIGEQIKFEGRTLYPVITAALKN